MHAPFVLALLPILAAKTHEGLASVDDLGAMPAWQRMA